MNLIVPILGVVVLFVGIILRHWFLEYSPPKYRREGWQEYHRRNLHFNPKWQPWYAWRPVRTIRGEVVWFTEVFRCVGNDYVDYEEWRWYHYGDIIDVLRYPE